MLFFIIKLILSVILALISDHWQSPFLWFLIHSIQIEYWNLLKQICDKNCKIQCVIIYFPPSPKIFNLLVQKMTKAEWWNIYKFSGKWSEQLKLYSHIPDQNISTRIKIIIVSFFFYSHNLLTLSLSLWEFLYICLINHTCDITNS